MIKLKNFTFIGKQGFTLVELLVVIAIMAILTTITAGQFVTAQKKAHDVARKGDLSSLSKALMAYFADYGKFPTATANGEVNISGASWGGEFVDNGYVYMKTVPQENFLKNGIPQYCYVVSGDQKSFALFAQLENGQDKDCKTPTTHCGASYCYSVVSPNKDVGDFTGL